MLFEGISYLELWQPFCSVERNHLSKSGRGYYEEQFCEIVLDSDHWFRRRYRLKRFLIQSCGGPPVRWSGTIYAISKEGIMEIIHVTLFEIWTIGSCHLKKILRMEGQTDEGQRTITIAQKKNLKKSKLDPPLTKRFVDCWIRSCNHIQV